MTDPTWMKHKARYYTCLKRNALICNNLHHLMKCKIKTGKKNFINIFISTLNIKY